MITLMYEKYTLEIDEVIIIILLSEIMKTDSEKSQDEGINVASGSNQRMGRFMNRGSGDWDHSK